MWYLPSVRPITGFNLAASPRLRPLLGDHVVDEHVCLGCCFAAWLSAANTRSRPPVPETCPKARARAQTAPSPSGRVQEMEGRCGTLTSRYLLPYG